MPNLARQRCFNHGEREAAVCCRECGRYFCRECATEHDGRMLCAPCIGKASARKERRGRRWAGGVVRGAAGAVMLGLVWVLFYLLGQGLLMIPSEYHKGEFWTRSWREKDYPSGEDRKDKEETPPASGEAPAPEADT